MKQKVLKMLSMTVAFSMLLTPMVAFASEVEAEDETVEKAEEVEEAEETEEVEKPGETLPAKAGEILVNGKALERKLEIRKDVVMLPLRETVEALDLNYSFSLGARLHHFEKGGVKYSLGYSMPYLTSDSGKDLKALAHDPTMIHDVTYVPLNLFTEILEIAAVYEEGAVVFGETEEEVEKPKVLTLADANKEEAIEIVKGKEFIISIDEESPAGYWVVLTEELNGAITLIDEIEAEEEPFEFHLKANTLGEHLLTVTYPVVEPREDGEKPEEKIEKYVFKIKVVEADSEVVEGLKPQGRVYTLADNGNTILEGSKQIFTISLNKEALPKHEGKLKLQLNSISAGDILQEGLTEEGNYIWVIRSGMTRNAGFSVVDEANKELFRISGDFSL